MGIPVFVTGRSGTGKTYSTKRIPKDKACFISVQKPRLPYRGDFEEHYKTDRTFTIIQILKSTDKKIVIIDDAQYLMANEYLRRADEKSYDKFTDIGVSFRELIDTVDELPEDVVVYFMWHTDTKDGITQMKTVGRMVDQYITPEGLSDIVLETAVVDGKYYFMTQNNGHNGVKSPEGMFPEFSIDNDLQYVDDAIRNYYYFEGSKTDEEIKEEEVEHIGEVEPPRRRERKRRASEETAEPVGEVESPKPRERKRRVSESEDESSEETAEKAYQKAQESNERLGIDMEQEKKRARKRRNEE